MEDLKTAENDSNNDLYNNIVLSPNSQLNASSLFLKYKEEDGNISENSASSTNIDTNNHDSNRCKNVRNLYQILKIPLKPPPNKKQCNSTMDISSHEEASSSTRKQESIIMDVPTSTISASQNLFVHQNKKRRRKRNKDRYYPSDLTSLRR